MNGAPGQGCGSRFQTFRGVRIHVNPVTGRSLGLFHRGFHLASLRPTPRNVLEKKIPGDPDIGGPQNTFRKTLDWLQNAKQS